jgi:hypothetical protein
MFDIVNMGWITAQENVYLFNMVVFKMKRGLFKMKRLPFLFLNTAEAL